MQRIIVIAFFSQLAVFFPAFMQLHGVLFLFLLFRKRNIDLLVTHLSQKRNLFVKKCCTLAGLMGQADPAKAITWKNFIQVSRILAPRYRDLG